MAHPLFMKTVSAHSGGWVADHSGRTGNTFRHLRETPMPWLLFPLPGGLPRRRDRQLGEEQDACGRESTDCAAVLEERFT
jgi:hypothetical protein